MTAFVLAQPASVSRCNDTPSLHADNLRSPMHASTQFIWTSSALCHHTYLFTCVDQYTRWPVAAPISDITADTVAHTFLSTWISIFYVPSTVTTDRGRQFESTLFTSLTSLMGCVRTHTTAYHPASNGIIERLHRQFACCSASR